MTYLITGGDGMLAYAFKTALKDRGHDFLAPNSHELDISDADQVRRYFATHTIPYVINCAGYTKVDLAESEPEIAYRVNETGPAVLARECNKLSIPLIHFSTDYVFDGIATKGYDENSHPHPLSVYGKSKCAGEIAIQTILAGGMYYIIRTSWLFGPQGKNFVSTIASLLRTKSQLTIVNDQFGSPTYTLDLARSVVKEIVENALQPSPGVYHLTNSGVTTWFDFAVEINALLKLSCKIVPIPTEQYPLPALRPAYSVLLNSKLTPLSPWKDALSRYLHDYL